MILDFRDLPALAADQELRGVVGVVGIDAGDEGVQALDLVDQALFHQEIQRAVDCGRHGAFVLGLQPVEELVGGGRAVRIQDQLQHLSAQRGQLRAVFGADRGGSFKLGFHRRARVGIHWRQIRRMML